LLVVFHRVKAKGEDRVDRKRRLLAVGLLAGAAICAVLLGAIIYAGLSKEQSSVTIALLVLTGGGTVILATLGLDQLLSIHRVAGGEKLPAADYRHTLRLFVLVALVLAAALVARRLAVPESFGRYGYFRAAAVDQARDFVPRYIGEDNCATASCHEHKKEIALHDKDAHAAVPCEDCHGAAWKHVADPEKNKLPKPKGKAECLTCHRQLAARPGAFPQISWREHFRFVGVKDMGIACTRCHSPHEPLYMDRDLRKARLHPLIQRCRDCHIGRSNEKLSRPEGHPAIFECSYCHRDIVRDFAEREHKKIECTTCHIFVKQSEFAGRIIRDADPRFCLLCHGNADFRSDSAPPGIDWPDDHLDDVAEKPEDRNKSCIDCHRDKIHKLREVCKHEP